MMQKSILFVSIIFSVFSVSCEKDVKNDIFPGFEPKLVITSFLSPSDTLSFISVTKNKPVYGEVVPFPLPGSLSGWISDGESEVLLKPAEGGLEFSDREMPVVSGKTYHLRVINEDGLSASADCSVPDKFSHCMSVDTFSIMKDFTDSFTGKTTRYRSYFVSIQFKDKPGKENYYRIIGKSIGHRHYVNYYNKPSVFYNSTFLDFDKDFFKDSEIEKNDEISITVPEPNGFKLDSSFVKIYLYDIEKSYYQYHKSLQQYKDDDNPFTEPTPVFSNIRGGLGIFTSYSVDSVIFRLR